MAKEKILVVDDEQNVREIICELLKEEGYEPVEAKDSEEAEEKTKKGVIDLALIDLKMPGMNGLQLIQRIRKFNPDIQIVIITGYPSLESAREAIREEVYDYLTKPFSADELKSTVKRSLEKQQLVIANKKLMKELKEAKANLEGRVKERTKELEESRNELKALLQDLKESKEYAEELFENATDAIFTCDLDGNFTSINKAAERQTGYTKEEALKMNISDILPPEDLKIAKQQIKDKVEGKSTKQPYELEVIKKDGTKAVWELATRLIVRNGRPVGIQGIARDITERKKMEEILIVSEERFRRLFEAAPDIIFRWNPETGIGYINPAVEIITGYTQEEIIGNMGFLLSKIHPEDMPRFMRELQSSGKKDGKIKSIEIRMIAKNGSIIWTEVRFVPIWDGQGNFLEIECIIRDISERRWAEEELKKKMQDLGRFHKVTVKD